MVLLTFPKKKVLVHSRDALIDQIILMRRQFPSYAMYGDAKFSDILSEQDMEGTYILRSKRMGNSYLENLGNGKFNMHELPMEAQFAPVNGMATFYTADQKPHLLITSNDDSAQVWAVQQEQSQLIALQPDEYYALVACRDGRTYKEEFYYGNSYLSQSSRWLKINPKQVKKVTIYNFQGQRREIQEEVWLTKP